MTEPASTHEPEAGPLARFVRSIAMLAMPAEDQLAWLRSLGLPGQPAVADELAMEFDDGYGMLSTFVERNWLPANIAGVLSDIDQHLTAMSADEGGDVWLVEMLGSGDAWQELRELAGRALRLI